MKDVKRNQYSFVLSVEYIPVNIIDPFTWPAMIVSE